MARYSGFNGALTDKQYKIKRYLCIGTLVAVCLFGVVNYFTKLIKGENVSKQEQVVIESSSDGNTKTLDEIETPNDNTVNDSNDNNSDSNNDFSAGAGEDEINTKNNQVELTPEGCYAEQIIKEANKAADKYNYIESESNVSLNRLCNGINMQVNSNITAAKDEIRNDAYYTSSETITIRNEVDSEEFVVCYQVHDKKDNEFYCYYLNSKINANLWQRSRMGDVSVLDVKYKLEIPEDIIMQMHVNKKRENIDEKKCIVIETNELSEEAKEIEIYDDATVTEFSYKIYIEEETMLPYLERTCFSYYKQYSTEGGNFREDLTLDDRTYFVNYGYNKTIELPQKAKEDYVDMDPENME